VLLALTQLVQLQGPFYIAQRDESVDLAVRIAGDVRQHAGASGALLQAVNRHDREQLIDRPAVGERLKNREVAKIGIRKDGLEILELLRQPVELAAGIADAGARGPVQPLGERPELERHE